MSYSENTESLVRCGWCTADPLYMAYHDLEWGVPVYDDSRLFEMLVLEGAQAGLSWLTILRKREAYRRAFHGFDPHKVAGYDEKDIRALLREPGIVKNRSKIQAAVENARRVVEIQERFGSLSRFLWNLVGGRPIQNRWHSRVQVPAMSPESLAMARELKGRGFMFVGPTICYAFMQAVGMVNDHEVRCFRHAEILAMAQEPMDPLS